MSLRRHRRLRGPLAALLLAIWTLGGGSDLIGHAVVAHVMCAEHGVIEHRVQADALEAHDSAEPATGPTARADQAPELHGEICQCAPPPAAVIRAAAIDAPPFQVASPSFGMAGVVAPAATVPLSYAPKTSPPV